MIDNPYCDSDGLKITGGAFGITRKAERETAQLFEPDSVCTDGGIVTVHSLTPYAFSILEVGFFAVPNGFQDLDLKMRNKRLMCTEKYMKTGDSEIFKNQNLKDGGYKPVLSEQVILLPRGKWVCLMGQSGKGKTTLLKTLLSLLPGLESDRSKATMSYLSQNDLLIPWKTILDNVVLGAKLRQETPDYSRACYLLGASGLEGSLHLYPHQLSIGMRQRAALVRTLMEDTDIILMDEPFSAVDMKLREELHLLTKTLLQGKTILFVSHDLQEALALADQILVLKGEPAVLKIVPFEKKEVNEQSITSLYEALYA